jgi:hypothetical protein
MITQTTFTNGILVAITVMGLALTADPFEKQDNKLLYLIVISTGGIICGTIAMLLIGNFPQ